jgi:acetoacetyl-CoA synthetase
MSTSPLWVPDLAEPAAMMQFQEFVNQKFQMNLSTYDKLHHWSIQHIGEFWKALCEFYHISFDLKPHDWFVERENFYDAQWLPGASLNYAKNVLNRDDEATAIISYYENGAPQTISFRDLRKRVAACAAFLRERNVQAGDRVAAITRNEIATVIAMLACASIGAIWANCSPEFGQPALEDRFVQLSPKLLFTINEYQYDGKQYPQEEKIKDLVAKIPSLETVVWIDRLAQTNVDDFCWHDFIGFEKPLIFSSLAFDHPLFILFSSGTTGKPKGIIHRAGGVLLEHIKSLGLHTNLGPQDRLFFYTTTGWMMWNWMLSALALGSSLVLYDGSVHYLNDYRLLDILEDTQATVFGSSAAYFARLEKHNTSIPIDKLPFLRTILSTGSSLLPHQYHFITQLIGRPIQISSISGGTDIVSCFALGNPLLPVYPGEIQSLGLGMDVQVFDELGRNLVEHKGELVCCKPFPTVPLGFWNDTPEQERFQQSYFKKFPNVWAHGDYAELTSHHGLVIYGRSDATLNPQGVRFGTAELYRVLEEVPDILECIAVSQDWHSDTRVVLFVKLKDGLELTPTLKKQIETLIRVKLSPRHIPAKILQVRGVPKTINGKVMEMAVRKLIKGEAIDNISVVANPECIEDYWNRKELMAD